MNELEIVILGLSITSSWGNGHATTFRGLVKELCMRRHKVLFLERDMPWYASNRDMPNPPYGKLSLYGSLAELRERFEDPVKRADLVIVGSYVPDGIAVGEWVTGTARGIRAFYDIDTPITLSLLRKGECRYLAPYLIPRYDLYLSFTGGATLDHIRDLYGAPLVRPLYCSVDSCLYFPEKQGFQYDLGYIGTYSEDRQPALERLLAEPAREWPGGAFVVAGSMYPNSIRWPRNVRRIEHLAPQGHRRFYNSQRFTLNITRSDMIRAGYSPSVRLFEAAACGTPIVSDNWKGIETFFEPGREILIAENTEDVLEYLRGVPEEERRRIGAGGRRRVLSRHTAAHRARELEEYLGELR